jgi:hypothetical protein
MFMCFFSTNKHKETGGPTLKKMGKKTYKTSHLPYDPLDALRADIDLAVQHLGAGQAVAAQKLLRSRLPTLFLVA